jgi:hypothetical protein
MGMNTRVAKNLPEWLKSYSHFCLLIVALLPQKWL